MLALCSPDIHFLHVDIQTPMYHLWFGFAENNQ
jgi:hypothetical protein